MLGAVSFNLQGGFGDDDGAKEPQAELQPPKRNPSHTHTHRVVPWTPVCWLLQPRGSQQFFFF